VTASLRIAFALPAALLTLLAQEKTNSDSAVLADFQQRVAAYMKLRKTAEGQLHKLKPTNSPDAIKHHEHELAKQIRLARSNAAPGNIFTPDVAVVFQHLVAQPLAGPQAPGIQTSLRHAEPVQIADLRVNGDYPERIPLQSTPASLLLNLPKLPPELEYRVVGRALILRDTGANLIVDIIPNALP
jgi:hypothetical protein